MMTRIHSRLAGLVTGLLSGAAMLTACAPTSAQQARQTSGFQEGPPRLVVMVSVDQLRPDLLDRYDDLFHHGFRRLRQEGFRFTGASHYHAHTETAAGHAALATGLHPARNGVVANNWLEEEGGEWVSVYAVDDPGSEILGYRQLPGRSPENLEEDGLADWILDADSDARVLSVSGKDRAAITMAGRARGEVYWLATRTGRFVTSEYYRDEYPQWVRRFNEQRMPGLLSDSLWVSDVPEGEAWRSRADTAADEGDRVHSYFPHRPRARGEQGREAARLGWLESTPFLDAAVTDFVIAGLEELELGQREATDFLAVSYSQTDRIGHRFGPLSREQLDNLLRLDVELGRLMDGLDRWVGEERWILAFSSDHGVLTNPELLAEQGLDARRLTEADWQALQTAVENAAEGASSREELSERIARGVEALPFMAAAYTHRELRREEPADTFAVLFRHSLWEGRAGGLLSQYGVEIRPVPYLLMSTSGAGTTHGSPYWYDRHVPLIFLGTGVRAGESPAPAYTVDVAPTLADLAGIRRPDDLDGRPLLRDVR